jgi:hypothetical protein
VDQKKSVVSKYLRNKLAQKLNLADITVLPWYIMKAGDILNWPSGVKFTSVYLMNPNEVNVLHKLVTEDRLHFSPEFLSKYKMIGKS